MATIFTNILERGIRTGIMNQNIADARNWLRNEAANTRISPGRVVSTASGPYGRETMSNGLGHMFLFAYDPITKTTLPFYDRYPLIFPFSIDSKGFYGINMHYLPFQYRAALMDALYDLSSNRAYDETTKLRLSYSVLNSYAKFKYFKPCVKRYLNSQVRSQFIQIPANEWEVALFLPLERFVGASRSVVHNNSIKIARGIQ